YGNLSNFSGPAFVEGARPISVRDPGTVLFAINGDRPAGMLQIDYNSSIMYGAGHIAFLYLSPEYRGAGLGVQLLGQAVSACRAKGCHSIALRVYENNLRAVGFYKKYGFTQFGEEPSFGGKLMLMSIDIRIPAVTS
ncbi:MAG: GNAT family N-acetyltransferase, partial [Oscillospiraceae bacterium]|nr:GNAT family N-acetyltransferase [Oscillospiraceae bacterium]